MFPSENTSPYYRFDALDVELKLSLYDVGGPDQVRSCSLNICDTRSNACALTGS